MIRFLVKGALKLKRKITRSLGSYLESDIDPRVDIGKHTYGLSPRNFFLFTKNDRVQIGKFCSFAHGVTIVASGEHNHAAVSTFPFYANWLEKGPERDTLTKGPVTIGNDVWVGINATILSGVTIGDGAVVSACSLVVKDVPPYAIVGGVPAKVLKYRFAPDVIEELLKIKWWDMDDDKLREQVEDFYVDVDEFISKYRHK